jgi:hypothetical protein
MNLKINIVGAGESLPVLDDRHGGKRDISMQKRISC